LVPDAVEILDEAQGTLRRWAEVAEGAWREDRDIAEALAAEFGPQLEGADPAKREKLETLNGIHSNAAGFRRWLEKRAEGGGPGGPSPSSVPHHHPRSSHA
jgi:lysophospholipase L1-like esterase